ncbi:MAG: hypothetical protein JO332_03255 [Planctomycetaceae bacterium]|nr:hypothetical protein [Planctomycetaceae bacterium]
MLRFAFGVFLTLLPLSAFAGPSPCRRHALPDVAITSPADGTVLDSLVVDVTVAFSAPHGNVKRIELLHDDQVLASFDNPPNVKSGTHTFPAVDLSSFEGDAISLTARAFQGNPQAGLFSLSPPILLDSSRTRPKPTVQIVNADCTQDVLFARLQTNWTISWSDFPSNARGVGPLPVRIAGHVTVRFFNAANAQVGIDGNDFDTGPQGARTGSKVFSFTTPLPPGGADHATLTVEVQFAGLDDSPEVNIVDIGGGDRTHPTVTHTCDLRS